MYISAAVCKSVTWCNYDTLHTTTNFYGQLEPRDFSTTRNVLIISEILGHQSRPI